MDSLTSINDPGKRLKGGGKQSYCLVNPRTDCRLHVTKKLKEITYIEILKKKREYTNMDPPGKA
ncbi:hypothetical protein OIU78_027211 [Salix suchowensis]|nr:hypothetical protein OIU78_027211 [Salix suchowensis]